MIYIIAKLRFIRFVFENFKLYLPCIYNSELHTQIIIYYMINCLNDVTFYIQMFYKYIYGTFLKVLEMLHGT